MRFLSKYGETEVVKTYMENVHLRRGGTLSLHWVKAGQLYLAAILRRHKGKLFGVFSADWEEAKRIFTQRIVKEGKRGETRKLHTLSLYVAPNGNGYRCIVICRTNRQVVDVDHRERIGSIALAFQGINKLCGCRHRKRYAELDGHWFSSYERKDSSRRRLRDSHQVAL